MPLLEVENVRKLFPIRGGLLRKVKAYVHAVDDVSFSVEKGETVALVGESGCGKSTLGKTILRLLDLTSGSLHFDGREISYLQGEELRAWRRHAQMIFQDPFGSLNPRMRTKNIVGEALHVHRLAKRSEINGRVEEILDLVGLGKDSLDKFPHEFSGGQRQRVGIARALAVNPSFIVADEPVSALDVSIQAQIINLLLDLQAKLGLAYLFISHDLRVVEYLSHRVAVMYFGKIVEFIPAKQLDTQSKHPYTKALLEAVPIPDPKRRRERIVLSGDVPNPMSPPAGCVFHPRCPLAEERCKVEVPELRELESDHQVACHLV